ncbi:MAG: hypothetical protein ACREAY_04645 [Nitrososphaera sp.]|uniref:hypothetical protein n=1 Tax=Nitrososphaera sp. TaxID=1971748 RepID=UPI003D6E4820
MESYNHDRVLSAKGLNTVLFSDPYAKLCYMAELASTYCDVAYIDLDTAFAAYFRAGLVRAGKVDIYLPSEGRFMLMFKEVLATMNGHSLVVLDSINSFYAMYYGYYRSRERSGGNLNHLLSVLLMLLVRQGASSGVPVLATSMLRYRKEGGWKQSPASRRLLQQKSASRTSVDLVGNDVVLRVLAHETMPEGTVISYPVKALG